MYPDFFQLISAKEKNEVLLYAKEKTHVALPAIGIVPRQHGDTSRDRTFQGNTPFQPGASQC
jgi:hypothetical protein